MICDDGGGVISDDDSDGGEKNFPLSEREVWLSALTLISGEAERLVRRVGLTGPEISAGGAREHCESWSSGSRGMIGITIREVK